jgi:lipid II:glycine glycyltransferase (peptidoglycan interpeptide bridge formation enzyme)
MTIRPATDPAAWDAFLARQRFRPFLQSWTMGDVYADCGQEPVRLQAEVDGQIVGICFGHVVDARRGKHLAIPYGPVLDENFREQNLLEMLVNALREEASRRGCTFIRLSPFWPQTNNQKLITSNSVPSPLHLLAEHVWYLPLQQPDPWDTTTHSSLPTTNSSSDTLFKSFRSTHRNLIRRAERDGVTVTAESDAVEGLMHFLRLHEQTRRRHGFTPYTTEFFRSQIDRFNARGECTVYTARYQGDVIAASVHMHALGETSYHHGASSSAHAKIPASHLLQWTAIQDAVRRGDRVYNFWGIAPTIVDDAGNRRPERPNHPFAGVTLFKTGFGGRNLDVVHCTDIPLNIRYYGTRLLENVRKWRRGF